MDVAGRVMTTRSAVIGETVNLVIASAHRDSARNVPRYMEQVVQLRAALKGLANLRVIAAEGDSADNTRGVLKSTAAYRQLPIEFAECGHGGPKFGSTEEPERLRLLSRVGNAIFDAVRGDDDVLLYVESDLIWTASVMVCLAQYVTVKAGGFDVFAPMVMAGELFYDVWGFRGLDGRRFSPFAPHFPGLGPAEYFEIGSAGSCLAIPGDAARRCRIRNDYGLVGWCEDARAHAYRIATVPFLHVRQA